MKIIKHILYFIFFAICLLFAVVGMAQTTATNPGIIDPCYTVAAITGTTTVNVLSTTTLSDATWNGTGTWSSSNTAIGSVNSSGVVTGVSAGTCTISYTTCVNYCATTTVTVNSGAVSTLDPSFASSVITLSSGNLVFSVTSAANAGFVRSTNGHAIIGAGGKKYYYETGRISGSNTDGENVALVLSTTSLENCQPATVGYCYYYGSNYIYTGNPIGCSSTHVTISGCGGSTTLGYYNGVELDCNLGVLTFYYQGIVCGSPITGLTGTWYAMGGCYGGQTISCGYNFGATSFNYEPGGDVAWNQP